MSSPQTTFLCIYISERSPVDSSAIIQPIALQKSTTSSWEEFKPDNADLPYPSKPTIIVKNNYSNIDTLKNKNCLIKCKIQSGQENNFADFYTIEIYKPNNRELPIILRGDLNLSENRESLIEIQGGLSGHILDEHVVFIHNTSDNCIYGPLETSSDNSFNVSAKYVKDYMLPYIERSTLERHIFKAQIDDSTRLEYMFKLPYDISTWGKKDCLLDNDIIKEIEKCGVDNISVSKLLNPNEAIANKRKARAEILINNNKNIQNFIRETLLNKLKQDSLISSVIKEAITNQEQLEKIIRDETILKAFSDKFKIENQQYLESQQSNITSEELENKENEIKDLQDKLKKSEQEINELNSKYQPYIELEEAKIEFKKLEKEIESKKSIRDDTQKEIINKEDELKKLKETYEKEFKDNLAKIRQNALEVFPFINLPTNNNSEPEINKKYIPETYLCHTLDSNELNANSKTHEKIHKNVNMFLESKGYSIDAHDLYNYLICTTQNFLTVLYGNPGVGKTSLVELVSEALYGKQNDKQRFLSISVAKGWTSTEDFIGYYNSLTQKFVASSTGFYNFVNFINESDKLQAEASNNISMAGVLLDEANLSVMEHYWSAFIKDTDKINEDKLISLFPKKLIIPNHLRFIATMNYDHTTEPLSGRILSRCPVIQIKPSQKTYTKQQDAKPSLLPFDKKDIKNAFMCNSTEYDPQLSNKCDEIFTIFETVKESFSYNRSQRDRNQILNYVSVALQVFPTANATTKSWDYAIAQFILPRLSFKHNEIGSKKLEAFKNSMIHYTNTAEILEKIIENGKENAYCFSYF